MLPTDIILSNIFIFASDSFKKCDLWEGKE